VIIAIDGPAGSGKSSTAREVARRLGALFVDTGAMYRAMALKAIQSSTNPEDSEFDAIVAGTRVALESVENRTRVLLDGADVSDKIRSESVSSMSSRVSKRSDVRERMVDLQRKTAFDHVARGGSVVMEGRDIGTVVFPEADFKFFVTASAEVRAKRRAEQLGLKGEIVDPASLLKEIRQRDDRDSNREMSPLRQSDDAVLVDTSNTTFEEQVENILDVISGNAGT
jgi:cytidylate kinase